MPDLATLTEAKILIEEWREEYNQVRPHSALNYRPPAPEATIPLTLTQQVVLLMGAGQHSLSYKVSPVCEVLDVVFNKEITNCVYY